MHRFVQSVMRDRLRRSIALAAVAVLAISGVFAGLQHSHAASYCSVSYAVTNQWPGGFTIQNITITNTSGSNWSSWTLTFSFPASGQAISNGGWNGTFSQSGQNVTVTNVSYNGSVAANASVNPSPGFNGTYTSSNPVPTNFAVNGNACGGSGTPPTNTPVVGATSTPVSVTPTATSTPTSGQYIKANQVLWIGDSWVTIPGNQHTQVRDLAHSAGIIGPNDDFNARLSDCRDCEPVYDRRVGVGEARADCHGWWRHRSD